MANAFSKEERVAFEDIMEGFQDALVLSRNVGVYRPPDELMERASNTIWRPQPYISASVDGPDATGDYQDMTQMSVPATLGYAKCVPWVMSASNLRDALQEGRLGDAAKQRLASDINVAIMNIAANQGTLFVKRSGAAAGFADVAACDQIMNEQGVPMGNRFIALSSADYNLMAADLAGRGTLQGKALTAYEQARIGNICGFEAFKLDYANSKAAKLGVTCTITADEYHVPAATSTAATGEVSNVDNRYQTVGITVTSGTVAVGDAFTIANVYAVHHITKGSTGNLKTFRVTSLLASGGATGDMQISPPIISATGGSDAELSYQNCSYKAAAGAAIVFLNTVLGRVNPFWHRDAIELLVGRYAIPTGSGAAVMRASTDQGIEVVMSKFYDIDTMNLKYRLDVLFGVCMKQPEMAGIMMFSQT